MAKKTQSAPPEHVDAVQVLKQYLLDMKREGRIAYIDESTQRVFRRVDGELVEVTSSNAHLFPEAVVWAALIPTDGGRHDG